MDSSDTKPRELITRRQLRLIETAELIRTHDLEEHEKVFVTRHLVQATLPYRSPRGNPPFW